MTMDSYWGAVLHEVQNKNNINCCFRYTTVGESPAPMSNRSARRARNPEPKKRKFIVGEPFPAVYFTEREFDCMVSLLRGQTVKEIALKLRLSPRTVEYYIKNLKNKLGCSTRRELMGRALETQLIKGALAGDH